MPPHALLDALDPLAPLSGQLGRYEIVRRLAVGGMAEVYLARVRGQHGFARSVVLKRIRPELARAGQFQRMFADEARVAAHLQHLNIAQVIDVTEEDGEPFLVMEYVEGRDVHALLEDGGGRGLPIEIAVAIALGVAAALHHAHDRRDADGRSLDIVHRDVSPSNVMVGYDGNVKLLDFGVAKARHARDVTRVGTVKGKAAYMSPEQALGLTVDRRSDLFSLGTLLHEILVGERPPAVGSLPVPPGRRRAGIPPALDALVMRLLARDPAERPSSAEEVSTALDAIAREERLACSPVALRRYVVDRFGEPEPIDCERPMVDQEPHTASLPVTVTAPVTAIDEVTGLTTEVPSRLLSPRRLIRPAVLSLGAAGILAIVLALAMNRETSAAGREVAPTPVIAPAAAPVVRPIAEPGPEVAAPPATAAPPAVTVPPVAITSRAVADPPRPDRRRKTPPKSAPVAEEKRAPAVEEKKSPAVEEKRAPAAERWDPDGPLLRSQQRRIRP